MSKKFFGTDGIRGVANQSPMTWETIGRLGVATGNFLASQGKREVLIGKDTRLSGYLFESALAAGLVSAGCDVRLTGPIPTPGVSFLARSMRVDAGVVISASHNPFQDNGIKLFASDGFKLPDAAENRIEELIEQAGEGQLVASAEDIGYSHRVNDAVGRYVVFCKSTFSKKHHLRGLKVVVDGANGAAYDCGPLVFDELGADVVTMNCSTDGKNINVKCGALHPEKMAEKVVEVGADIGIAFDGDADRVFLADEKGNVIDGDSIMAIAALNLLARDALPSKTVVATVMSNLGLELALKKRGAKLVRTQVGDRHVVEAMRKGGYPIGGEQSGHLIFLDHSTTGDGIVAALRILEIMVTEGRPLSELTGGMERVPQVLVNRYVKEKQPLESLVRTKQRIKDVEEQLGDEGRVLVRYSGTEAKVRVMLEGTETGTIKAAAEEIAQLVVDETGGEP